MRCKHHRREFLSGECIAIKQRAARALYDLPLSVVRRIDLAFLSQSFQVSKEGPPGAYELAS
jgi:hypothetical protein